MMEFPLHISKSTQPRLTNQSSGITDPNDITLGLVIRDIEDMEAGRILSVPCKFRLTNEFYCVTELISIVEYVEENDNEVLHAAVTLMVLHQKDAALGTGPRPPKLWSFTEHVDPDVPVASESLVHETRLATQSLRWGEPLSLYNKTTTPVKTRVGFRFGDSSKSKQPIQRQPEITSPSLTFSNNTTQSHQQADSHAAIVPKPQHTHHGFPETAPNYSGMVQTQKDTVRGRLTTGGLRLSLALKHDGTISQQPWNGPRSAHTPRLKTASQRHAVMSSRGRGGRATARSLIGRNTSIPKSVPTIPSPPGISTDNLVAQPSPKSLDKTRPRLVMGGNGVVARSEQDISQPGSSVGGIPSPSVRTESHQSNNLPPLFPPQLTNFNIQPPIPVPSYQYPQGSGLPYNDSLRHPSRQDFPARSLQRHPTSDIRSPHLVGTHHEVSGARTSAGALRQANVNKMQSAANNPSGPSAIRSFFTMEQSPPPAFQLLASQLSASRQPASQLFIASSNHTSVYDTLPEIPTAPATLSRGFTEDLPAAPVSTPSAHNQWERILIHTAKCDSCGNHNTNVMLRCKTCS